MSINEEWMVGPTYKMSLSETLVEVLAEASKTALILVVVLDSFCLLASGGRTRDVEACQDRLQVQVPRDSA